LGVFFALLDPDPDSATQINADPDPKSWFKEDTFWPVMANKNKIFVFEKSGKMEKSAFKSTATKISTDWQRRLKADC
jgi:hypothetical protein